MDRFCLSFLIFVFAYNVIKEPYKLCSTAADVPPSLPYDTSFICHVNKRRIPTRSNSRISTVFLLLLAGDISPNPGPIVRPNCAVCQNRLDGRSKPVTCSVCASKVHSTCSGLRGPDLVMTRKGRLSYYCSDNCMDVDRFVPKLLPGFDLSFEDNCGAKIHVPDPPNPKLPPDGKILIGSANVNSLRGKFLEVYARILAFDYAAFCIQETKLGDSIKDNFDIPGYVLFRRDRDVNGGGVAIYCKNDYQPTQCRNPDGIELIAIQLKTVTGSMILASVYRPPNGDPDLFTDSITSFLSVLDNRTSELTLMGDLNWDSVTDVDKLNNLTTPFDLVQLVDVPTHNNRSIDLLFTSNQITWGLGAPVENHHAEIWCHVVTTSQQKSHGKRSVWLYDSTDWAVFCEALVQLDLISVVSSATSVGDAWNKWKNYFLQIANVHIPRKLVKCARSGKNWFNRTIKRLIRQRDNAYRQWKTTPTCHSAAKHKRLRKKVKKAIFASKKLFYSDQFENCKDQASYWKTINHVTGRSTHNTIPDLITDCGTVSSDAAKSNAIADQYDSVFNRVDEPVLPPSIHQDIDAEWLCNEEYIYEQLMSLDIKKSHGPDGITARMLFESAAVIAPSVSIIINRSFTEGIVPSEWKLAIVTPIPKVKNSNKPSDYRPVSLLCIISKIAERCFARNLDQLIDAKLPQMQYGFRRCRSTEDAIAILEHKIINGFNQCCGTTKVCGIFFDISKAFDTVPIGRLITSMENTYQIPPGALCWLRSYLTNRKQMVRVNNSLSSERHVLSGVPQGSVLGPKLFNAYSAPALQLILSHGATCIAYADDLAYVKKAESQVEQEDIVKDANAIATCFTSLGLSLNVNKTVSMLFTLSNGNIDFEIPPSLQERPLNTVKSFKYLGVWLDRKLSWSLHSQKASTKSRQAIGSFSRQCRNFVPQPVFCHLYKQVILPSLLYGLTVAFPINVNDCNRIERAHIYAARIASNNFDLPPEELLLQLHWKPISRIINEKRLILLHKYYHGERFLPNGILIPQRDFVGRNTRGHDSVQNDSAFDRSFPTRGRCGRGYFMDTIGLWNRLTNQQIALDKTHFKTFVKRRQF